MRAIHPPSSNKSSTTVHRLSWALLVVCVVWLWQSATVRANYRNHWTALFCTGALQHVPPALHTESIYTFPNSYGYDGQFYHYIAHDPFQRRDFYRYIDEPGLRYRRLLVPLFAWLLAGGRDDLVDYAYYLIILMSFFLGTYWLAGVAQSRGRCSAWGLLFMATPAAVISADRMLVDGTLTALTVAFVIFSDRPFSVRLWLVLACAALTRETGVLLTIAYASLAVFERRSRDLLLAASALVPCTAWYVFVDTHMRAFTYHPSHVPFSSIFHGVLNPTMNPTRSPLSIAIEFGDLAAAFGAILALALGLARQRSEQQSAAAMAAVLFTVLGAFVQRDGIWMHLGRVFSPLLIILITEWIRKDQVIRLAPVLLLLPRGLIQLASQMLGVLRALRGSEY